MCWGTAEPGWTSPVILHPEHGLLFQKAHAAEPAAVEWREGGAVVQMLLRRCTSFHGPQSQETECECEYECVLGSKTVFTLSKVSMTKRTDGHAH